MNAEWFVHTDRLGSDHFPICISYPEDISRVEPSHTYNIKKADWNLYTRYANIQTDTNSTNTDSKYSNILNGIKHAADLSIPKHSPYINGKIKVPWWTTECRTALNQRNKTFRHFKNHPTQENFINYKKAQAEAKKVIKEAKRKSWREFISNINRNTTRADCWNTIRVIKGKKCKVGARYLKIRGKMVMNQRIIANEIAHKIQANSSNNNCTNTFLQRKKNLEYTTPNFNTRTESEYNKPFEYHELEKVLNKVKGTSPGPDGIRYEMIKHLNIENKNALLNFYNDIWKKRELPTQWEEAIIIPILKPGKDSLDPDSYRPIALTNCLCKILERLVNNRLLYVLEKQRIINPYQSGFRRKRCTHDNTTILEHDIKQALTNKQSVLTVFLDMHKAYDMAWRRGILEKLYELGFRGNLPIFINNLISHRTFRVRIGNTLSELYTQENGVPQGSVISPTLFMLLINDILKDTPQHIKYSLYADDIAIWSTHHDINIAKRDIQETLNTISNWQDTWGTRFSSNKSNLIIFTNKRKIPKININIKGEKHSRS